VIRTATATRLTHRAVYIAQSRGPLVPLVRQEISYRVDGLPGDFLGNEMSAVQTLAANVVGVPAPYLEHIVVGSDEAASAHRTRSGQVMRRPAATSASSCSRSMEAAAR
jgi:hypothetical protein